MDPQQLASVGLNRPLLRLRLTPRRRVTTTAPGGGGTETAIMRKTKMVQGINQPVEGCGGPPQPPDDGG